MALKPETRINQTAWLGGVCYYASAEDGCPAPDMFAAETELLVKVYYSYSARDSRKWNTKIRREPADLALIQLRAPVDRRLFESGRADYACLPPALSTSLPASLHNIGWGAHGHPVGDHLSAHLRFVRLLTQPRKEWSPKMQNLRGCRTSRALPRFCQYPPQRDQAASYLGDSGSGALARRGDEGAPGGADVLYAVQSSVFRASYSINASDPYEPYVQRILGDDVSVQHHLHELCYYLQLGCGVKGITGVGSTLRLSSFYLKRQRSEMPSIAPFTLLSDDGPLTNRAAIEEAVATLVDLRGKRGVVICLAMAISPRHLVTTRKCIMEGYLRAWKGQKQGMALGGDSSISSLGIVFAAMDDAKEVEFIAWQRAPAGATPSQPAAAGSELVIVQLTSDE